MVRELACWPIAYQADGATQEQRNIGILVHESGRTELRLMGQSASGEVESAYFCKAFDFSNEAGGVYQEWVRWFCALATEASDEELLVAEFDRLKRSGSHFCTGDCIRVVASLDESIRDIADRMFQRLVLVPKLTPTSLSFSGQVDHLIRCSEIAHRAPFHRNVELELQRPDQTNYVQLTGFVEVPTALGIKELRFQGRAAADVATQINDIRYTFETLIALEILDRSRCVVIHDTPKAGARQQLQRIGEYFVFLPVDDPSSPSLLRDMVPIVAQVP